MTSGEKNNAFKYINSQLKEGYIDLSKIDNKNEFQIIELAMMSLNVIDQLKWERDVALEQLKELELGFGEKTDEIKKAIEFKKYFDQLYGEGLEIANWHLNGDLEPFDNFYNDACEC